MSVRQSRAIAGAVALFAFAAVVLEVALVRMFSALLGQHFGVVWGMVLPVGVGVGALLGVLSSSRGRGPFDSAVVAHLAAFAAPCAAIAVIVGVRAKGVDNFDAAALQQCALFLGTSLLPFVFVGLAASKVVGTSQRHAAGLLRTALAASACALVAASFLMRLGPARVGLGVAVLMSLSAVLFARATRFDSDGPRANASLVATFVLGTSVVLAGEIGAPYLKLASLRWVGLDKADTQMWTARAFYTVDKPHANSTVMRVDGTFGRSIPDSKQVPPLAVDEMPYLLDRGKDPVLIIGAGGGRELRAALRQGHHDVRATEDDIAIARAIMRGSSYAFSEQLYDNPEIHVHSDGATSYVRKVPTTFQRIVFGYYDSQAASPSGALAALPNHSLTTEFVQDLLGALRPTGTLTIMRPEPELDRLIALVAHALRARGSRVPSMHVFGCARDKLSTLLVKRTPLQSDELSTLRAHCRRHKFPEILSPDAVHDDFRKALMAGIDPQTLPAGKTSDLRPPTADRPFWFHTAAPGRLLSTLRDVRGLIDHHRTLLTLVVGTFLAAVVGLLALFVSLLAPARVWGYRSRIPVARISLALTWTLAAIALFGMAFIGRVEPVIGRPDVVHLFLPLVFLMTLAVGAGFSGQFDVDDARAGLQRWLLATTFVLAPLLMGLEGILAVIVDFSFPVRLLLLAAGLGLVGLGLGAALGLAVRTAASWGPRIFACALAHAGSGTAVASLIGLLVAMTWGYSATMLLAGVAMLGAIFVAASARTKVPTTFGASTKVPTTFGAPTGAPFEPLSSGDTASDDDPISFREHTSSSTTASA